jgi:AraC-like DNA-binding protein
MTEPPATALAVREEAPLSGTTRLRAPTTALRSYVRTYQGYQHISPSPVRDVHLPIVDVPFIIGFGDPLVSINPLDFADAGRAHRTFIAGLFESASITESAGLAHGVQVNFTPLGAYQFLGRPMHELSNRVIELEDIVGARAASVFVEALHDATSWDARFAIIDAAIAGRLAQSAPPSDAVAWAWSQIQVSRGRASIAALTSELGWSRKHMIARFREEVGLPPKTLARIVRFQHAVRLLERDQARWSEVAVRAGYYDQPHFIRDFRAFAGSTPGAFVARRRRERAEGRG